MSTPLRLPTGVEAFVRAQQMGIVRERAQLIDIAEIQLKTFALKLSHWNTYISPLTTGVLQSSTHCRFLKEGLFLRASST